MDPMKWEEVSSDLDKVITQLQGIFCFLEQDKTIDEIPLKYKKEIAAAELRKFKEKTRQISVLSLRIDQQIIELFLE